MLNLPGNSSRDEDSKDAEVQTNVTGVPYACTTEEELLKNEVSSLKSAVQNS